MKVRPRHRPAIALSAKALPPATVLTVLSITDSSISAKPLIISTRNTRENAGISRFARTTISFHMTLAMPPIKQHNAPARKSLLMHML